MRIATLILSLVLMLVVAVQSLAAALGGSLGNDEDLSAGGSIGMLVALLWLAGAAFVLAKPGISKWLFGIAAPFALMGGSTGFSDLYIWGFVSIGFALMSWRGQTEKAKNDEQERARYQADVTAAAAAVLGEQPAPIRN